MNNINNIVRFYRDCYLHDFKGITITNIFTKGCEISHIPESFELLSGRFEEYTVPNEWGQKAEKILFIDSKEKGLFAGSFFIKGTISQLGKQIRACAPLYIHELNLRSEDGIYYIQVEDTFINPTFVDCINSIDSNLNIKYDNLVDVLPPDPIGFQNIAILQNRLSKLLINWNLHDIDDLLKSDYNNTKYSLDSKNKLINNKAEIYAFLCMAIIQKPVGSRGVINELTNISEQKITSSMLSEFFVNTNLKQDQIQSRPIHVPTSLSAAQKKVFFTSDTHDVSMVIGPPGTGKSFTIAALTIDFINRNKSVLIASKNNQAGRVIAKKIENDLGIHNILIKTDRQTYRRSLRAKLSKIVYGILKRNRKIDLKSIDKHIKNMQKDIDLLISELVSVEKKEIKWGKFYFNEGKSIFDKIKGSWIEYKKKRINPVWKLNQDIQIKQRSKNKILKSYIRFNFDHNLKLSLRRWRKEFIELIEALDVKTGNALEERFHEINFKLILKALPVWICNSQDISRILPLKSELFDVLIIDEASQCDIATMIPLLFRAKKIIVAGDPNQLRHYSFLSDYQQNKIRIKYNLDENIPNYRKSSLIDLTNKIIQSQDQITFLDEHYRSKSDIISFSNKKFYDNLLKVMRGTPHSQRTKNTNIVNVKGKRNNKGVNEIEANSIVAQISRIIVDEESIANDICSSIGIISPFTAQTNYIKTLIKKKIEINLIKKHKLLIGTPYHFQGEERDVILLSFALDNDSHHSSFNYLNKEDVFNVSITRARDFQYIFTSIDISLLDPKYLISQYLNDLNTSTPGFTTNNNDFDYFLEMVMSTINAWGVDQIYPSVCVSGVDIDLAVVVNNKTYCIDLIGFPGNFSEQFTPENILMLNRMNQDIFFIPYSSWVLENDKTKENLMKFLEI